ncbi:MAG: pyridoxal phosphate-dependent aminotransferase [Anaerolineae bacterium]|nr:pyridoxal phosphate-dependent aminotransferase [Anaerolineae bacterium]
MTTPTLSQRGQTMPMSAMRKLSPAAQAAQARGVEVIRLNLGQPDIETPAEFWNAVRAFPEREPTLAYAPSAGRPELVRSLVRYYRDAGIALAPEELVVTVGGCEAILFALLACGDPGGEIITPEPYYSNYAGVAAIAGMTLAPVTTHGEDGYHLPGREAFEAVITPKTRALLYASPGNPTGAVYTRAELALLGDLARDHGLFLLADEVYREFTYDGATAASVLHLPGLDDHAVLLDSVSKRYSACGARIGCIASHNAGFMQAVLKLAMVRLSAPALAQAGIAACIDTPPGYMETARAEYQRRRDLVVERLNAMEGVSCRKPAGAFYVMARMEGIDAEDFARWLLSDFEVDGQTVMVAPGAGFYATPGLGRDEIRLAYVLELEKLARAMTLLAAAVARYRREQR